MKNSQLIILMAGSALMLAGAAAEAQGHRGGPHGDRGRGGPAQAMMMLRAADANGDNSITSAEVDALQAEMFDWMDRNSDGFLDQADENPMRARLQAIREAEMAERGDEEGRERGWRRRGPEGRGGRGGPDGGPPHMRADADGDGRISRAEFLERENTLFNRLDADENGVVTPEELDAAVEQRQERREERRRWWRN
ncbi:EF-hand domain-containing protein [Maricaulis parjimensis]|uniref:EF-hand domain-containing protein n=1 Tax=Maricaulis parjimensis TaxID=144023 RepID=UPI001939317E|nr:hypothetical protein [Maricaulis parjimensis]